jgi:uncharacterized membrane-anchored protein
MLFSLSISVSRPALAQDSNPPDVEAASPANAEQDAFAQKLAKLYWVRGPKTVAMVGNSKLTLPQGYVFLNKKETGKFLELTENLGSGDEMLVAPESLSWAAYFSFSDEGYVKDDEKIDADALLKSLQEATEAANGERAKRGWAKLYVTNWAVPPAYNRSTKRLEWATTLKSNNETGVNFFTKILGRQGHTTIVMVTSPGQLNTSEAALNNVLAEYRFNPGHTYADFRPGDKVAEYGLAALVLGGAAAVATKKGFWAVLAGFFAAAWKFVAAGVIALGAWLKKFFSKSTS